MFKYLRILLLLFLSISKQNDDCFLDNGKFLPNYVRSDTTSAQTSRWQAIEIDTAGSGAIFLGGAFDEPNLSWSISTGSSSVPVVACYDVSNHRYRWFKRLIDIHHYYGTVEALGVNSAKLIVTGTTAETAVHRRFVYILDKNNGTYTQNALHYTMTNPIKQTNRYQILTSVSGLIYVTGRSGQTGSLTNDVLQFCRIDFSNANSPTIKKWSNALYSGQITSMVYRYSASGNERIMLGLGYSKSKASAQYVLSLVQYTESNGGTIDGIVDFQYNNANYHTDPANYQTFEILVFAPDNINTLCAVTESVDRSSPMSNALVAQTYLTGFSSLTLKGSYTDWFRFTNAQNSRVLALFSCNYEYNSVHGVSFNFANSYSVYWQIDFSQSSSSAIKADKMFSSGSMFVQAAQFYSNSTWSQNGATTPKQVFLAGYATSFSDFSDQPNLAGGQTAFFLDTLAEKNSCYTPSQFSPIAWTLSDEPTQITSQDEPFSSSSFSMTGTLGAILTMDYRHEDYLHFSKSAATNLCFDQPSSLDERVQTINLTAPVLYDQVYYLGGSPSYLSCYLNSFSVSVSECDDSSTVPQFFEYGLQMNQDPGQDLISFHSWNKSIVMNVRQASTMTPGSYQMTLYASLPNQVYKSSSFNVLVVAGSGTNTCRTTAITCANSPYTYTVSTSSNPFFSNQVHTVGDSQVTLQYDESTIFTISPTDSICTSSTVSITLTVTGGPRPSMFTLNQPTGAQDSISYQATSNADVGTYTVKLVGKVGTSTATQQFNVKVIGSCYWDSTTTVTINQQIDDQYYIIGSARFYQDMSSNYNLVSSYCRSSDVQIYMTTLPNTPKIMIDSAKSVSWYSDQTSDIGTYAVTVYYVVNSVSSNDQTSVTFNVIFKEPGCETETSPLVVSSQQSFLPINYVVGSGQVQQQFDTFIIATSTMCDVADLIYSMSLQPITTGLFTLDQTNRIVKWQSTSNSHVGVHTITITPSLIGISPTLVTANSISFQVTITGVCSYDTSTTLISNQVIPDQTIYINEVSAPQSITPFQLTSTYCLSSDIVYSIVTTSTVVTLTAQTLSMFTTNVLLVGTVDTVKVVGKISFANGSSATFSLPDFKITVLADCYNSQVNSFFVQSGCAIPDQYYAIGDPEILVDFPAFIENADLCVMTDIKYSLSVAPKDLPFLNVDGSSLQVAISTDSQSYEGVYDITILGSISTSTLGTVQSDTLCKFKLTLEAALCELPGTTLESSTLPDVEYSVGTGLASYTLTVNDNVGGGCWKTWSYKLFVNDTKKTEIVASSASDPKLTFDSATLHLGVQTSIPTETTIPLILVVSRQDDPDFASATFNVLIKVDANNAPMFQYGQSLNQTTFNMTAKNSTSIELGASYDIQNDAYSCNLQIMPSFAQGYFTIDCETGSLKFKREEILALSSESDLVIMATVTTEDQNQLLPLQNHYIVSFLVPGTHKNSNTSKTKTDKSTGAALELDLPQNQTLETEWLYEIAFSRMWVQNDGYAVIYFSEPVMNPEDLSVIDETMLDVKLLTTNDLYEQMLSFTWSISAFTSTKMTIDIKFEHPLYISSLEDLDQLQVTALDESYLGFRATRSTEKVYVTLKKSETITKSIPMQFGGNKDEVGQMKAQAEMIGNTADAFVTGGIVINIVLASTLSLLWGLVNTLQVITHFSFLNVQAPQNAQMLNEILLAAANLDILPLDDFYKAIFPFLYTSGVQTEERVSARRMLQEDDEEEFKSPMAEVGGFFLSLLLLILFTPFICIMNTFGLRKWGKKLKDMIFFSASLQVFMENYISILLSCLLAVQIGLKWVTSADQFIATFTVTTIVACILFPFCISLYLYLRFNHFRNKNFKSKFHSVIADLHWRKKLSPWLFSLFCYRRLVLVVLIVYMANYSYAQIQIVIQTSAIGIIILGTVEPLYLPYQRNLEFFNESMILICAYHYICFTQFVDKPETRYVMGTSLQYATIFTILSNAYIMCYFLAQRILYLCKKLRGNMRKRMYKLRRRPIKKRPLTQAPHDHKQTTDAMINGSKSSALIPIRIPNPPSEIVNLKRETDHNEDIIEEEQTSNQLILIEHKKEDFSLFSKTASRPIDLNLQNGGLQRALSPIQEEEIESLENIDYDKVQEELNRQLDDVWQTYVNSQNPNFMARQINA